MPAANIEEVLAAKPVTFKIKTSGGSWKCQLHSNRAAYERSKAAQASISAVPGIVRTDSGLSTSTVSSSSSSSSASSH